MTMYSRGKVYQVIDLRKPEGSPERCAYVGSTVRALKHRWSGHRTDRMAQFSMYMQDYGVDNFRIELVELWPCSCKQELRKREQHYMNKLKPTQNIHRAHCENKITAKCECGLLIKDMAKHMRSGNHDKQMRRKRLWGNHIPAEEWRKLTHEQRCSFFEKYPT